MPSDPVENTQRIIYLLSRRLKHRLTEKEEKEIQLWKNTSLQNEFLFKELADKYHVTTHLKNLSSHNTDVSMKRIQVKMAVYTRKRQWIQYIPAASVVLLIGFGLLFYKHRTQNFNTTTQDVQPGRYRAQLTLYDGSLIALDSLKIGESANQKGIIVTKTDNGKIICNYSTQQVKTNIQKNQSILNTITTPMGGAYEVVLPDGSKVSLNANSSLKFPSQFQANERFVELVGEAYFDIIKDENKPFKLAVHNRQDITVLGTKFNVLAYEDEPTVRTTLLEGAIKVNAAENNALLRPGQEAKLTSDNHLAIVPGNIKEAIAWKNGYFIFNNENIESIMRKVSRWYDIEVSYEGNVKEIIFGGTFSKSKSLNKLLKSFESTGQIRYKLAERRVTIMAN